MNTQHEAVKQLAALIAQQKAVLPKTLAIEGKRIAAEIRKQERIALAIKVVPPVVGVTAGTGFTAVAYHLITSSITQNTPPPLPSPPPNPFAKLFKGWGEKYIESGMAEAQAADYTGYGSDISKTLVQLQELGGASVDKATITQKTFDNAAALFNNNGEYFKKLLPDNKALEILASGDSLSPKAMRQLISVATKAEYQSLDAATGFDFKGAFEDSFQGKRTMGEAFQDVKEKFTAFGDTLLQKTTAPKISALPAPHNGEVLVASTDLQGILPPAPPSFLEQAQQWAGEAAHFVKEHAQEIAFAGAATSTAFIAATAAARAMPATVTEGGNRLQQFAARAREAAAAFKQKEYWQQVGKELRRLPVATSLARNALLVVAGATAAPAAIGAAGAIGTLQTTQFAARVSNLATNHAKNTVQQKIDAEPHNAQLRLERMHLHKRAAYWEKYIQMDYTPLASETAQNMQKLSEAITETAQSVLAIGKERLTQFFKREVEVAR